MRRATGEPRPGWEQTVLAQGMVYGAPGRGQGGGPRPYWDESVHYVFEMDEILSLEADVEVVHSMCLQAVDHVVTTERFRDFALPEWCWEGVAASWRRSDPHVYGRFDLRYDGSGPAKLLEYNADTPTTLLEASILQWNWLKDVHPDDDQWNSLHEKLVERWAELKGRLPGDDVYFTWSSGDSTGEDHVTVGYLQETAAEAGLNTVGLAIEDRSAGTSPWTASSTSKRCRCPRSSSSTPGSGCSTTTSASTWCAACRRRCGWNRCGRRC